MRWSTLAASTISRAKLCITAPGIAARAQYTKPRFHYGTIYETKVPLWEETVRSGHPIFGDQSPPRFTAWPDKLPATLPAGAVEMDDSDPYFGAWIDFGPNELAAFEFCQPGA